MEINKQYYKLVSKEDEIIEFDEKIGKLSSLIEQSEIEENLPVSLSKDILNKIKDFCEVHDYNDESMTYRYPFVSEFLQYNIDQKSYAFINKLLKGEKELKKIAEILGPLLQASFYLGFSKLSKIINVTLQCPFFCIPNEEGVKDFQKKWNMTDQDLSLENKQKVYEQNKHIFEVVQTKYLTQIQQLFTEYENSEEFNQQKI